MLPFSKCYEISYVDMYLSLFVIYVSMSTEGGGKGCYVLLDRFPVLVLKLTWVRKCSPHPCVESGTVQSERAHGSRGYFAVGLAQRGDYVMSASAPMIEGGESDWKQSAHGAPCEHVWTRDAACTARTAVHLTFLSWPISSNTTRTMSCRVMSLYLTDL